MCKLHYIPRIIGSGARGGKGGTGAGSSLGATVSGIIDLNRHEKLFLMIGQAGSDASAAPQSPSSKNQTNKVNYAGGGGGATYVFTVSI